MQNAWHPRQTDGIFSPVNPQGLETLGVYF